MTKQTRYSSEALMEVFGTSNPNPMTIINWKNSWRESSGKINVQSYTGAYKILRQNDIDPLFYQQYSASPDSSTGSMCYIAFFKPEHQVFFKLHNDNS